MLPKYYLNIIGTTTLVVPVYATIKGKLAIGGKIILYRQAKSNTSSAKPKKTINDIPNSPDIWDNNSSGKNYLVNNIPNMLKTRYSVAGTTPNDSGIFILPASVPFVYNNNSMYIYIYIFTFLIYIISKKISF